MFLELQQEVWIPSSCHGDLREPLMLSLGSQESFRIVRGLSGFLSSWCGQLGPHLELRWETQGSSPALTGISGSGDSPGEADLVSCGGMEHCFPLEVEKGCQASCRVEVEIRNYLYRCHGALRPPFVS